MRHFQRWFVALLYIAVIPTALIAQGSPEPEPFLLPPPLLPLQRIPSSAQSRVQSLYGDAAIPKTTSEILPASAEFVQPPLVPPVASDNLNQVAWDHENIYSDSAPYYESDFAPFIEDEFYAHDAFTNEPLLPFGLQWTKHRLTTTVLPGSDDGLGMTTVDFRTQFSLKNFPIVQVTPRFRWHSLDGPDFTDFTDLPNNIFEHAVDFSLYLPVNEQWSFYGGLAPGLYTDYDNNSSDAFRLTGQALLFYKRSEQLKLAFGFVYLDREDVTALPVAGVTYVPAGMPNLKFDIMFPKPRISYRYSNDGSRERSIYLSGEFGGGSWAIERVSGVDDVATYGDLKLALGVEHKQTNGLTWFLEGGYVFSRDLEYTSGAEFDLDDTGMIRVGLAR